MLPQRCSRTSGRRPPGSAGSLDNCSALPKGRVLLFRPSPAPAAVPVSRPELHLTIGQPPRAATNPPTSSRQHAPLNTMLAPRGRSHVLIRALGFPNHGGLSHRVICCGPLRDAAMRGNSILATQPFYMPKDEAPRVTAAVLCERLAAHDRSVRWGLVARGWSASGTLEHRKLPPPDGSGWQPVTGS